MALIERSREELFKEEPKKGSDEGAARVPGLGTTAVRDRNALFAKAPDPDIMEAASKVAEGSKPTPEEPDVDPAVDVVDEESSWGVNEFTGRLEHKATPFSIGDLPSVGLGVAETLLTMATDLFGAGVGTVGGVGAALANTLEEEGTSADAFVNVFNEVREFTRWDPKSVAGKTSLQMIGDGFNAMLVEPSVALADGTFELTGSPLAAAVARTAPEALLFAGAFKGLHNKWATNRRLQELGRQTIRVKDSNGGKIFTVDELTNRLSRQHDRILEINKKNQQSLTQFESIELDGLKRQVAETAAQVAEKTGLDAPTMRNAKGLIKQLGPDQLKTADLQKVIEIQRKAAIGEHTPSMVEVVMDGTKTTITKGVEELIAATVVGERNVPVRVIHTRIDPKRLNELGSRVQHHNIQQMMAAEAFRERSKLTIAESIQSAYDISAPFKARIAKLFGKKEAQPMLEQYQLMQNSGTSAMTYARKHFEPIFSQIQNRTLGTRKFQGKDIPVTEEMVLNEIVHSRVMGSIVARRPGYKTPGGMTGEMHAANLQLLRKQIGDTEFSRLSALSDQLFDTYRDLLGQRLRAGVIDKELHQKLVDFDYEPTQHLSLHDPWVIEAGDKSVRSSGVLRLKDGNVNPVEISARDLLHDTIHRTFALTARNKFFQRFYAGVQSAPKDSAIHGFVRELKSGETPPTGFATFEFFKQGEKKRVAVDPYVAKAWQAPAELEMIRSRFDGVRWLTGVTPVRAIAVGANFAFPFIDLPRAVLGIAFSNNRTLTGEPMFGTGYKTGDALFGLPISVGQMTRNMIQVHKDVRTRSGLFEDIAKRGGYPRFLAEQGLTEFRAITKNRIAPQGKMGKASAEALDQAMTALSSWGVHAEALMRTAVAKQAINRGLSMDQAAFEALRVVNYNEAGTMTAMFDNFVPFFNASFQVGRAQFRGAIDNPASFAAMGTSVVSAGMMAYWGGWLMNDEAMRGVTDLDLATGFNIPMPKSHAFEDADGNIVHPYWHIPADGALVPFLSASAWANRYMNEGRSPSKMLVDAITKSVLPLPNLTNVPMVDALLAVFGGYDSFRKQPIYPRPAGKPYNEYYGEHERNATPMGYVEAGRWLYDHGVADVGLEEMTSPERLHAAVRAYIPDHPLSNFWWTLDAKADPSVRELYQSNWELYDKAPILGRFLRIPRGSNAFADMADASGEIQAKQENARRLVDNMAYRVSVGEMKIGQAARKILEMREVGFNFQEGLASRLETEVLGKRAFKRMPREERQGIPTWEVWRSLGSTADHTERARKFYAVWENLSEVGQRNSMKVLNRLTAVGDKFKMRTPQFNNEFLRLKEKHGNHSDPNPILNHTQVLDLPADDEALQQ